MFLRTQRLFLRPAWPEDAPELTRAIGQEAIVRMLARVPWPYAEEDALSWIASMLVRLGDVRVPFLPPDEAES